MTGELPLWHRQVSTHGGKYANGKVPDIGDYSQSLDNGFGMPFANQNLLQGPQAFNNGLDGLAFSDPLFQAEPLPSPSSESSLAFRNCFPQKKHPHRAEITVSRPDEESHTSTTEEESGTVDIFSTEEELARQKEIGLETANIMKLENNRTIDAEQLRDRAEFNISEKNGHPDLELLAPYLMHRKVVKDPAKQKQLDSTVLDWAKQLNIQFSDSSFKNIINNDKGNIQPADFATKVVIASQMATLLRNRPDLFEQLQSDKDTRSLPRKVFDFIFRPGDYTEDQLTIVVQTNKNDNENIGGLADHINNANIDSAAAWDANPKDGYNITLHEITHLIDRSGQPKTDGILWHMSNQQKRDLKSARNDLKEQYDRNGKPPEGFSEYSFNGKNEFYKFEDDFLAETTALFAENPEALHKASSKLYDVYKDYFKVDPLNE